MPDYALAPGAEAAFHGNSVTRGFRSIPVAIHSREAVCGMTYRIVQWTTGNIGVKSVHAIVENSLLELVGCYAWSPDKVGRDVGELCGIEPLGVLATDDVDALIALEPHCVVYNQMFADVDHLVRILEAGINVVTTSEFITGHRLGDGRERVAKACELGGSTIFGSGLNPGFIQLFAIVSAGLSDRIDRVYIEESFDTTIYNSPETEKIMGFGYPIDHPGLLAVTEEGSGIFREAVMLVADALGVELDEIRCEAKYAQATEDVDLPGDWVIAEGCVAGIDVSWKGYAGDRDVVEVRAVWTKGQALEPDVGDGLRLQHHGRGAADDQDHPGLRAAGGLRGGDDRGVHPARPDHHRRARRQRHTRRRRGAARHRDIQRSAAVASTGSPPCLRSHADKTYRIIQWMTGDVGQVGVRHFADNPVFDLVAVLVHSEDKVGKDAGEIAGIEPIGVVATDDIESIIAIDADCVFYTPIIMDVDTVCRLLQSGKNVVTTSGFFHPSPISGTTASRSARPARTAEPRSTPAESTRAMRVTSCR